MQIRLSNTPDYITEGVHEYEISGYAETNSILTVVLNETDSFIDRWLDNGGEKYATIVLPNKSITYKYPFRIFSHFEKNGLVLCCNIVS